MVEGQITGRPSLCLRSSYVYARLGTVDWVPTYYVMCSKDRSGLKWIMLEKDIWPE